VKGTVAIIGSHPRTRGEFDFDRTDCDIWVFNEAVSGTQWCKRADAVFQMHAEAIWRNPANRNDPEHLQWLQTQTGTVVYMQEQYSDVPRAIKFPIDEIVDKFHIRYFTSSVAYALALACHLNYKRIELYGAEMETNTEYQFQRDGVALWLGVACGLGIELDLHISLFDQPLYGYEGEVTMPYERFGERITELKPALDDLSAQYKAAMVDLQKAFELFSGSSDIQTENTLFAAAEKQRALSSALGEISGRMQENKHYQGKADTMRAAAGEYIFSRQEFESAASDLKKQAEKSNLEYVAFGNTLDHIHRNVKVAAKKSPKRAKLMEVYRQHIQEYLKIANRTALFVGASKENYEFLAWLDKHIRAAGGQKSEAVLLEMLQNA
jgi:hypothetical protein